MILRAMTENTGVEINELDVKTLDEDGFAPLYEAWLKYGVIVVRDQHLEIEDFLAYSDRFGKVVPHPSKSTRHPDYPKITMLGINKFDADGNLIEAVYNRGGASWHTDGAYDDIPFKATQLYSLAIPSRGGDTHFSNMYMAYEALPDRLKTLLDGKRGAFTYAGRRHTQALLNPEDRDLPPAFHPMFPKHSETGRTSLYFDPEKINYIEGLDEAQNDDVIEELTERMIAPDAEYRHQWQVGDVVIWDNRSMVHKAAGDYPPKEDRIHWRTSIK
jgi:taurine dioxygenase